MFIILYFTLVLACNLNSSPLTKSEQDWLEMRFPELSENEKTQKINSIKVFSKEAKKARWDQNSWVDLDMKNVLSQAFLEQKFKELGWDINQVPSEGELKKYYEANALYNVRHIVVDSAKIAETVKSKIGEKVDFLTLVKEYSIDPSKEELQGRLENLGSHNFPPFLYDQLKSRASQEWFGPIEFEKQYHFFQIDNKKAYSEATGPYLAYLADELKKRQWRDWETNLLVTLQKRKTRKP